MCKCKVCNREFRYGDGWSPMFTDKIWWDLLDFYNLWRYEAEAKSAFHEAIYKYERGSLLTPFVDKEEYHCDICYKCAEKALGRKLVPEDVNNSLFNESFKKIYFKTKK